MVLRLARGVATLDGLLAPEPAEGARGEARAVTDRLALVPRGDKAPEAVDVVEFEPELGPLLSDEVSDEVEGTRCKTVSQIKCR